MIKVTLDEIKQLAANARQDIWNAAKKVGREPKIYLHWSAGKYDQTFDDYHISITGDGSIYVSTENFADNLSHTFGRNTGGVGIALCCAFGATTDNLGDYAPTAKQIEVLAQATAAVADGLWLTIDLEHIMTHGEAADNEDGLQLDYRQLPDGENGQDMGMYGPKHDCERWDLEFLGTSDSPAYNPWATTWATNGSRGGDVLRGKANWYRNQEG
ncbi:N-acetylmuramoyl-L-alanine amidase [Pectinatus frisingensis]|uniref:peptidoglycan recognition protein family protein n=1 Tax=Pectinatus frisingensis TaxID=865 RepID=UPI0018C6B404|nr:N-acetylmuramoyl-L-alanine amidase [Pectinatus frisingensis]